MHANPEMILRLGKRAPNFLSADTYCDVAAEAEAPKAPKAPGAEDLYFTRVPVKDLAETPGAHVEPHVDTALGKRGGGKKTAAGRGAGASAAAAAAAVRFSPVCCSCRGILSEALSFHPQYRRRTLGDGAGGPARSPWTMLPSPGSTMSWGLRS